MLTKKCFFCDNIFTQEKNRLKGGRWIVPLKFNKMLFCSNRCRADFDIKKRRNDYRVDGEFIYIKLKNSNLETIVDKDIFFEELKNYNWYLQESGYVYGYKNRKSQRIHQIVCKNSKKGWDIDHINQNKLDNRKNNLRIIEHWLNGHNRKIQKLNKTGVSGVTYDQRRKKWCAKIGIKMKYYHLGYFESFIDAVNTRQNAEKELAKKI